MDLLGCVLGLFVTSYFLCRICTVSILKVCACDCVCSGSGWRFLYAMSSSGKLPSGEGTTSYSTSSATTRAQGLSGHGARSVHDAGTYVHLSSDSGEGSGIRPEDLRTPPHPSSSLLPPPPPPQTTAGGRAFTQGGSRLSSRPWVVTTSAPADPHHSMTSNTRPRRDIVSPSLQLGPGEMLCGPVFS